MQKKIRKVMSVFMVSALLFSGCGIHGTDNVKKEENNENNNIVKLTVWSEKDNVDTTSKMVFFHFLMISLHHLLQVVFWLRYLMLKK